MIDKLDHLSVKLFSAKSGFVTAGPGGPGSPAAEDITGFLLTTLLGAFLGLLTGIVSMPVFRFSAFIMGRQMGSSNWIIAATALGALLFACLSLLEGE